MRKVIIAGGTGFIGQRLAAYLTEKGFEPILLARHVPKKALPYRFIAWDGVNLGDWKNELQDAFALVNLAGRSVDCIKSPDNRDVILRSRVDTTRVLGLAMNEVTHPPKIWVQMSTAHIYGDPPGEWCTERSSPGMGLAPFVGQAWEKAFLDGLPEGTRGVRLRTSFVIGKNGGALHSLKRIAKMGLGGKVGHGRQGISWIHEEDMSALIHESIVNEAFSGMYIASAPNPVSNARFMGALRKQLGIPFGLPAPAWMTAIGAKYIFNTDPELAIYGRYVTSERLEEEGFNFRYPHLEAALNDLLD